MERSITDNLSVGFLYCLYYRVKIIFSDSDCFTLVPRVRNDVIARKYDEAILSDL